jgi:hypothetical protein
MRVLTLDQFTSRLQLIETGQDSKQDWDRVVEAYETMLLEREAIMKLSDVESIIDLGHLYFRSEDWMRDNAAKSASQELREAIAVVEPMGKRMIESEIDPVRALGEKVLIYVEIMKVELTAGEVSGNEGSGS